MEFRVEVTSADAAARLRAIAAALPAVTEAATLAAGHVAERHIQRQLTLTSHPKGTPTPSLPGQPPALVSGTLRRSLRVSDPQAAAGTVLVTVGPTILYGRIHELGGDTGRGHAVHLPKRPYVKPGVLEAIPEVEALFRAAWAGVLDGS